MRARSQGSGRFYYTVESPRGRSCGVIGDRRKTFDLCRRKRAGCVSSLWCKLGLRL